MNRTHCLMRRAAAICIFKYLFEISMEFTKIHTIVKKLLKCFEYNDAIFLAERSIAEGDNSSTIFYYLALAHEHIGKPEKSLQILNNMKICTPASNYLHLKLLYKSKKHAEIQAFIYTRLEINSNNQISAVIKNHFAEYSGSAIKILAQSQRVLGNTEICKEMLHLSLSLNPFLWSSVEILCHMRDPPDFSNILQWSSDSTFDIIQLSPKEALLKANSDFSIRNQSNLSSEILESPSRLRSTPLFPSRRKNIDCDTRKAKVSKGNFTNEIENSIINKPHPKNFDQTLILEAYSSIGNVLILSENYLPNIHEQILQLPEKHRDNSYINSLIGAVLFHQQSFNDAQQYFDRVISTDSYWTKHMDECSSNLWQLKNISKLEHLVDQLSFNCPLDPELDPYNPYPYTLMAQELHVTNGNSSETTLKNVIHLDPLHYPAWYFLGRMKAQQQKYSEAIKYLCFSSEINPNNTLILTLISYCFSKDKKFSKALETIERAINIEPDNLLLKYEHAVILFDKGMFIECITELKQILNVNRYDSAVLLLTSKCYYSMDMLNEASEYASRVINQNKANPFAETEARDLLKMIGLYQSADTASISKSPIKDQVMNLITNIL
ncbi:hypothetical protein HZS_7909 [Henneguya salminicola]|nr:hypothetical protein HZS_7909 [Henneguya salminicola]